MIIPVKINVNLKGRLCKEKIKSTKQRLKTLMKLYDHQTKAIQNHLKNKRTLCGFKPGMGKTLVALTASVEALQRTLVIVPAYLRENWKSEIKKFYPDNKKLFNVISYHEAGKMVEGDYDCVVLDESHYIKNMRALRTLAVHKLVKNIGPKRTLLLSGTPIKNRIPELYSQLKLLSYGDEYRFGSTYLRFCSTFCNKVEKYFGTKKQVSFEGYRNLDLLKRVIAPVYFDIPIEEALDLPDQIRKYVNLGLATDCLLADVDIKEPDSYSTKKKNNALHKVGGTEKYINNLLEEGIKKIVVFSDHPDALNELSPSFINSFLITGQISVSKRSDIVEQFNKAENALLFCSIGAASVGLNLQTANHMVFNDYPWTYSSKEQAEKRIHRIGQKQKCFYHYMLEGEIDRHILNTLEKKKELIGKVL